MEEGPGRELRGFGSGLGVGGGRWGWGAHSTVGIPLGLEPPTRDCHVSDQVFSPRDPASISPGEVHFRSANTQQSRHHEKDPRPQLQLGAS